MGEDIQQKIKVLILSRECRYYKKYVLNDQKIKNFHHGSHIERQIRVDMSVVKNQYNQSRNRLETF